MTVTINKMDANFLMNQQPTQ